MKNNIGAKKIMKTIEKTTRKPKKEMKRIEMRIEKNTYLQFVEYAERQRRTVPKMIQVLIENALESDKE